jgi:hypothetical protein
LNLGELVAIKKSKCVNLFCNQDEEPLSYQDIYESVLGDFLFDSLGGIVYAPKVFDMAIIKDSNPKK